MPTEDTPWLSADEQRAWRRWLMAHAHLMSALGRDLAANSGLSLPDYEVLVHLSEADDARLRITALATAIQWERSRLSHHLTRMQARGLVERTDCITDRRGAFVSLTPEGRAAIEGAAPGHVRAVRALFLDPLTETDVADLDRVAGKILDAVVATELSDEPAPDPSAL